MTPQLRSRLEASMGYLTAETLPEVAASVPYLTVVLKTYAGQRITAYAAQAESFIHQRDKVAREDRSQEHHAVREVFIPADAYKLLMAASG